MGHNPINNIILYILLFCAIIIITNYQEKYMRTLGNIIWLVFGGLLASIGWFISGILLCITIIGIPFGVQCFKIANLVLWPFKKEVEIGISVQAASSPT